MENLKYFNRFYIDREKDIVVELYKADNMDEITYIAKDKVTLTGEDLETFQKMLNMLDEVEDVQTVYHNVEL